MRLFSQIVYTRQAARSIAGISFSPYPVATGGRRDLISVQTVGETWRARGFRSVDKTGALFISNCNNPIFSTSQTNTTHATVAKTLQQPSQKGAPPPPSRKSPHGQARWMENNEYWNKNRNGGLLTFWASGRIDDGHRCLSRGFAVAGVNKPNTSSEWRTADTGARWTGLGRHLWRATCGSLFSASF